MDVETPYELLKDDQKKQLDKNNEAKMTFYNALPRNSQVKDYKIDLLIQQYENFSISNEETIDNAKVTTIEEAKDLTTLPLNELIGNLKVYEMILENDGITSKTTNEKAKSLALKAKVTRKHTSDDSDSQGEKIDLATGLTISKEAAVIVLGTKATKAQDKGEVVTIASKKVTSLLDVFELQKENEELLRFNKDFTKKFEKLFKEKRSLENEKSKLLSKINDLEIEVKKLANDKEVVEPCEKCDVLAQEVDSLKCNISRLQDEALNFSKFKKISIVLDDMLSR
ncbi:hypothetical protein Tco_0733839 [Tanacetum coccineum]